MIFQYPQARSCGLWLSLESEVWKTCFTLSLLVSDLWSALTQLKLLVLLANFYKWNSKATHCLSTCWLSFIFIIYLIIFLTRKSWTFNHFLITQLYWKKEGWKEWPNGCRYCQLIDDVRIVLNNLRDRQVNYVRREVNRAVFSSRRTSSHEENVTLYS